MRKKIVEAARSLIGTPFQHQARVAGVAVDCIGLLVCVSQICGVNSHDFVTYAEDPDPEALLSNLRIGMVQTNDYSAPGNALLFWINKLTRHPQHFGIRTDKGFVHAHRSANKVAEHQLTRFWQERIVSAWEFRL